MRLRRVGAWLLGASLGSCDDNGVAQTNIVTFADFKGQGFSGSAVFLTDNPQLQFTFNALQTFTVNTVFIKKVDGDIEVAHGSPILPKLASATLPTQTPPTATSNIQNRQNVQLGAAFLQEQPDTSGSVAVPSASLEVTVNNDTSATVIIDENQLAQIFAAGGDQPLYFEVDWSANNHSGGQSFSRVFAVTQSNSQAGAATLKDSQYLNKSPAHPEVIPNSASTGTGTSGQPTGGGLDTGSGGTSTATPTPSVGVLSASSAASLSTGAIAGIAVACAVIGLAVIALLVWLLVRRRKTNAAASDGVIGYANGRSDHHRRTAEQLMAEKEATAGIEGGGPHSPYSEDGNGAAAMGGAGAVAATEALRSDVERERDFPPYTDQPTRVVVDRQQQLPPQHVVEDGGGVAGAVPRTSAPSQMSGRYAHLIEEGMTPEEIARLEEEERHLDRAIEQAGQPRQ